MALIYCLVARGASVLAEWSPSAGNFATVTRVLLSKINNADQTRPLSSPGRQYNDETNLSRVSYTYDGRHVFHCLVQKGDATTHTIRYMVMADRTAGVKIPYRFLQELRRRFIQQYGFEMPQRVMAQAYTDSFSPTMKEIQTKFNDLLASGVEDVPEVPPELQRVRDQIDVIQNVMFENTDKLMARAEKIDILVDRVESFTTDTFQFRRQTQQLQRMMWWRQRKLRIVLATCVVSVIALITISQFGLPFVSSSAV